jgi:rhomboid family GlyGly-CTERM serine protease
MGSWRCGAELRAFLVLAAAGIVFQLSSDESNFWLVYDREAVLAGQWWRLLTGNLVHLSFSHLWLNLAALLAIIAVLPDKNAPSRILIYLLSCGIAVTAGLQWFSPDMVRYSGLSGALHGLFVIKAYHEWPASRLSSVVMIGGLGIKVGYEQLMGGSNSVASLIGGPVAVDAHLFGAIGGLIVVLGLRVADLQEKG